MTFRLLLLVTSLFLTLTSDPIQAQNLNPDVAPRQELRGKVTDVHGQPLSGESVFVFSAGPRVGKSTFCPTCYPDCRKRAETDGEGSFLLKDLDPKLVFTLLAVGNNTQPQFVEKIDPLNGPVQIKVVKRETEFPPNQSLRGKVVDPSGTPVSRAVVSFEMFTGLEANCLGGCEGVDLVSVTDDSGNFVLSAEKKFATMGVRIEAPGYARKKFSDLEPDKDHQLELTKGSTVSGRIVRSGKGVAGIAVGLVPMNRSDPFPANLDTFTDSGGNFKFLNVPPLDMYYVYSHIGATEGGLITPVKTAWVLGDGTVKQVGDLELEPGMKLKARILLSDKKVLPPNTEIRIVRQSAGDVTSTTIDLNGFFEFNGLPQEPILLNYRLPGYRISEKNMSLDRLTGIGLIGVLKEDTSLELLMEPGQFEPPPFDNRPPGIDIQYRQQLEKPLQGIIPEAL